MKVHRTSSSRKARRKNEGSDWLEWNAHLHANTPAHASTYTQPSSRSSGRFKHVLNLGRLFKSAALPSLPHPVTAVIVVLCASLAFLHLSSTFNSRTRFHELSNVEREVTLPSNAAVSYAYFKRIAEADSYVEGLRRITRDGDSSKGSSFQRFSLAPQALLAGGFHVVRAFAGRTGWGRKECRNVSTHSELGMEQLAEGTDVWATSERCSGLSDPLNFYLTAVRLLESCALGLVVVLGLELSGCVWGGVAAGALCLVLHPQGWDYSWAFPGEAKIGWALALLQLTVVSRDALGPTHPPWSATVKVGISTALLICCWNGEAQWLLTSQLLIVALLHILGALSRYRASLVVFGALTGWEWASLVSVDVSLHHWSLFLYAALGTSVTLVVVEPLVDWIMGKKRDRWTFFRRTILLITLQTVLIAVRFDLAHYVHLHEDSRFPLSSSDCQAIPHMNHRASCAGAEEPWDGRVAQTCETLGGGSASLLAEKDEEEALRRLAVGVSGFARRYLGCEGKMGAWELARKEGWMILGALYCTFTAVLLPQVVKWALGVEGFGAEAEAEEEDGGRGRAEGKAGSWWREWVKEKERGGMWEALVGYHALQAAVVGVYCVVVDRAWELLFVTQLALLVSLAADWRATWRLLKRLGPPHAPRLHCAVVALLVSVLLATARIRVNQLNLTSRGRFEVGNPRVADVVEGLRWIRRNTNDALFAGPENLMAAMELALFPHTRSINAHLTAHSWAHSNPSAPSAHSPTGTSGVLTQAEMEALGAFHSVFSRSQSVAHFHDQLRRLNVTHLLLSPHMCPDSARALHTPPANNNNINQLPQSASKSKWLKHSKPSSRSQSASSEGAAEERVAVGAEKPPVDECALGCRGKWGGTWQWLDNWQQPAHVIPALGIRSEALEEMDERKDSSQLRLRYASKAPALVTGCWSCDWLSVWEEEEACERRREAHAKCTERWSSRAEGAARRGMNASVGKWKESEEVSGEAWEDTLCHRLLHERNLAPFRRVFHNSMLTIFALAPPSHAPTPLNSTTRAHKA